jgi:hypothetical protein
MLLQFYVISAKENHLLRITGTVDIARQKKIEGAVGWASWVILLIRSNSYDIPCGRVAGKTEVSREVEKMDFSGTES